MYFFFVVSWYYYYYSYVYITLISSKKKKRIIHCIPFYITIDDIIYICLVMDTLYHDIDNEKTTNRPQNTRSRFFHDWRCIGYGSYGVVFRVYYPLDRREYAIKCILANSTSDVRRILEEVQTLASMDHPNIVRYHSCWIDHYNTPFIDHPTNVCTLNDTSLGLDKVSSVLVCPPRMGYPVTVCIQLKLYPYTLRERLSHEYDYNSVCRWLKGISCGLIVLRQHGFVHKDLNPNNILITDDDRPCISDLGKVSNHGSSVYIPPVDTYRGTEDAYALIIIYIELLSVFSTSVERLESLSNPLKFLSLDSDGHVWWKTVVLYILRQKIDILSPCISKWFLSLMHTSITEEGNNEKHKEIIKTLC